MITYTHRDETVNDPFEHEIEYDRLCDALTGRGADTMVIRLHASQQQLTGSSKLSHLHAVSELSGRYADLFYNEVDFNAQRYYKTCCKLAGLLHESMEWGGVFEQIVEVADETVARMVADLTPDRRTPRPKRRRLYFNQVGLARPPAQLVKFADMQHEAQQLALIQPKSLKPTTIETIRFWVDDAQEIIPLLDKIKGCYALNAPLAKLKVQLDQLNERCVEAAAKLRQAKV
jgi:hypothetical protein